MSELSTDDMATIVKTIQILQRPGWYHENDAADVATRLQFWFRETL